MNRVDVHVAVVKVANSRRSLAVGYQIVSGEESGTVRANGGESSRRFFPHIAMVKATDTR